MESNVAISIKILNAQILHARNFIYINLSNYTRMLTEALLVIEKSWNPPKCPSVGNRLNKLVHP